MTTSPGWAGPCSSRADHGANCPYASSTITSPGAAPQTAAVVAGGSARPVGLFGEHKNVMSGRDSPSSATASSRSIWKSSSRAPSTTSVPVMRAMCECSAYVGSKSRALRPGPPKASRRHCSTSLDPLAQKTSAARDPVQSGDRLTKLGGRPIGIAVERDVLERGQQLVAPRRRAVASGDSFVLSRTSAST